MRNKDENILSEGVIKNGNIFYSFKQLDNIPQIRLEAYLARNHEFDSLGMKIADLKAFCLTVEDYGNQGRYMEVQQLNGYFKSLLDKPVTLYPMIYLASPLVVLNDEPIEEIRSEYETLKQESALNNIEVESFFLGVILDLKPSLRDSLSSGQTSVYFSKRERILEELFHQAISGRKITRLS